MLKMTPKGSVGSYKFSRSTVELETNINPNSLSVNAVAVVATTAAAAAAAAVGNGKMSQGMPAEVLPPNLRDDEFHLHNLLENVDQGSDRDTSWRKYARLVLPHIGLVVFVCLYAMFGAWVFYSIESPHEDRLKVLGIRRVYKLRQALTGHLMERRRSGEQRGRWMATMEEQLNSFSDDLFKSYKEQYVRYENVRLSHHLHSPQQQQQQQQLNQPPQMDPRFRRHFSKSRSDGKLWTPSSSLFFAATTMATIGYGNIVPVTSHGRIACIIFALFGAPLTIITIGDLGKFLSECTIWLYRRLKDKFYYFRYSFTIFWLARRKKRRRRQFKKSFLHEMDAGGDFEEEFGDDDDDVAEAEAERRAREQLQRLKIKSVDDWDEQENTEVPVLLVFAILLLYIAAGGVLFAIMESWTYMDAFYYCFVSLTTIGFGDLVPDRHEYIVLMLIYLGVGLAVTTMCIDLVGIQYIQKIHYFGRKFKGTDILQILRRKRMLERRFAMGEGKELIEYVIKHEREALFPSHQPRGMAQPVFHLASQAHSRDQPEEEKISLNSEQEMAPAEEARVQDVVPMKDLALARAMDIPRILEPTTPVERKLSSPTIETPSSESERLIMYSFQRHKGRADSWAESGPTPSLHSSTPSTAPSVQQRELLYEQFRSPQPSITSFAFTFTPAAPPSPDLRQIAEAARSARRQASCPLLVSASVSATAPPRRKWHTLACPSHALAEVLRFARLCVVIVPFFESLSRKISSPRAPPRQLGKLSGSALGQLGQQEGTLAESLLNNNAETEQNHQKQQQRQHALELVHHEATFEHCTAFLRPEVFQAPKAPSTLQRFQCQPVWYYRRRRSLMIAEAHATADSHHQQDNAAASMAAQQTLSAAPAELHQPILKRKRRERQARRYDPLQRMDWLALSPRIAITEQGLPVGSEELDELMRSKDIPLLLTEHPAYRLLNSQPGGSSFSFDLAPSGSSTAREGLPKSMEHIAAAAAAALCCRSSTSRQGSVVENLSPNGRRRRDESKTAHKWKNMALRARVRPDLGAEIAGRTATSTSKRQSVASHLATTTKGALTMASQQLVPRSSSSTKSKFEAVKRTTTPAKTISPSSTSRKFEGEKRPPITTSEKTTASSTPTTGSTLNKTTSSNSTKCNIEGQGKTTTSAKATSSSSTTRTISSNNRIELETTAKQQQQRGRVLRRK